MDPVLKFGHDRRQLPRLGRYGLKTVHAGVLDFGTPCKQSHAGIST
jgi:hypothetical protein